MTHTELVFRGTFGHILVAYIKKVVCQLPSVLKKEEKHGKLWLTDRLVSLGEMILTQDALLTGMGICSQRISTMQFLTSCDSPKVTWVLYNHALLANNSWAIQQKYFRTIFSTSFPVYNFFKLNKKEDSNNLPQGTSLGYYPASWKEKKKTHKKYWQLYRPVKEKDDNFLLHI